MKKLTKFDYYPSLQLYEDNNVPYILCSDIVGWTGPLWVGHCMMLDPEEDYGDPAYFHELCHWQVASLAQRTKPDFALGRAVNTGKPEFTVNGNSYVRSGEKDKRFKDHNVGWGEKTVKISTARNQENLACFALIFYEPMTYLWDWDGQHISNDYNTAIDDFNCYKYHERGKLVTPSLRNIRATWKRVLNPLRPDVTEDMVVNYWYKFKEFREELDRLEKEDSY